MSKCEYYSDLIWKHTHRDFKGHFESGERSIMYASSAGTTLGSVEGMPDKIYVSKLVDALLSEAKTKRDLLLKPLYIKYGAIAVYEGSNQWRDSIQDVVTSISSFNKNVQPESVEADILDLGVKFPELAKKAWWLWLKIDKFVSADGILLKDPTEEKMFGDGTPVWEAFHKLVGIYQLNN